MQDSERPPDIFVLHEKSPLGIESAQAEKQNHILTWQQGFWEGRDEEKVIPKNRKTCWREKTFKVCSKAYKDWCQGEVFVLLLSIDIRLLPSLEDSFQMWLL